MRYKNGKLSKEQSQKKCETLTCDLHAARKKAQKIRDTLRADQARLKELNGIILPLRKQKQTLQAKMKPYAAMKKDVEDFLLGDWFRTLSRADGKELLRRLQEECRMQSPGSASGNAN